MIAKYGLPEPREAYIEPMKLILARHGEAEPGKEDRLRNLTDLGKEDIELQSRALISTKWRFSDILSSPVVRARQTAELICGTLENVFPSLVVNEEVKLSPGVDLQSIDEIVSRYQPHDVVIMTFHMPDVARVASYITGMPESLFYFPPGAMIALNLPLPVFQNRGMLIWMYQPEYMRNILDNGDA